MAQPAEEDSAAVGADIEHGLIARGEAARLLSLVEPTAEGLGFEIIRIRMTNQNGRTLQIMAERPDGTMNVEGCEDLSHALSALLDVEDPISGTYSLEVSSPGIDRPLTRAKDFERWAGHVAKVELTEPVDGRKRFRGRLEGFEAGEIRIEVELKDGEEPCVLGLPLSLVFEAKLVMTDELVRESLKRRP